MKTIAFSFIGALFFVAGTSNFAKAHDVPAEASSDGYVQDVPPAATRSSESAAPDKRLAYDMYRRDELRRSVPRTRNALIGTSVSFGVGLALLIPVWAGNHCVTYSTSTTYERVCDTTGKVLTGIGSPLAWGGSLGMIVSGIMLGVRKGKIRRLDERIMLTSDRRLQWDLPTSRLVF